MYSQKVVSKNNYVLARCLVKLTVVANTRAWSFIVEKLQSKIVVISWFYVYPKFSIIWGYRTGKWLSKPLPGINNGRQQQYTIWMFSLLWQHIKCAAKHIDNELYVAKEKIQNHMKSLSTNVSSKCLQIRLLKVYRPSRHGFYGRPMISGLLKDPKKD